MRVKLTKIMDPTGFERPLVAGTTVIPADWTATGGIVWRVNGQCTLGAATDWTATSPDGKSIIRLPPAVGWRYNNSGNPVPNDCIPAAINSADQYVSGFIGQLDNAKIVDVERDPQLSQALAQQPFSYEMPGDPYVKAWWDAASVTFTYTRGGEPYLGTMIVMTTHNYMMSGHSYGFGQPMESGNGGTIVQVLMAAPADKFAEQVPAFLMFLKNYQPGQEWQARMNQHNAAIARDLSLRETANKVGVSPTYLSRVENCLDPSPPTEKTLRALADVLEDNLDELMQLAGRVPEDVEKLIKADPDMPVMLRRAREQNVTGAEFLEWLETKKKGGK